MPATLTQEGVCRECEGTGHAVNTFHPPLRPEVMIGVFTHPWHRSDGYAFSVGKPCPVCEGTGHIGVMALKNGGLLGVWSVPRPTREPA